MSDSIVTIKRYADHFVANLAVAKLDNANIKSFLENDEGILINPGILSNGNIKLKVNASDAEAALTVLNAIEA